MKIAFDTFGCDHARSGLGSYLYYFISNLPAEKEISVELFGSELDRYTYTSGTEIKFETPDVANSLNAQRFWHFTSENKFIQSKKYNAVIYPAPERVLPVKFKVPGIVVVNSILSSLVEGKKDWQQKLQIKRGLNRCHKIIAASKVIRDDLISHGIDADKIEVVYNGIDHKLFYPPIEIDSSADFVDVKPFAIKKPYFIYGSRLSGPEKKHVELIKAFSLFKEKTGLPHRLVIAGDDGPYSSEVHKASMASKYASDIFLTGYFPHESFAKLYAGSEGCVFPAVNEGAGLPVLEAMATGVPVACSNSGVFPEICKDSVLYFDSDNIQSIADTLEVLVTDVHKKDELIKKGLEQAENFSWEKTVLQTFDIVKKLI